MFLPVFQDLIKPQWRAVLAELKLSGGVPVSELARTLDISYMAAKQQCEDLKEAGYLDRSRVPRTAVGRPEIFYSLSAKADDLFPQAGVSFTLGLLEEVKALFGESGPEKVFYRYFQTQQEHLQQQLAKTPGLVDRVVKLAALRVKGGCCCQCKPGDGVMILEEIHNPLQRVFECYPRVVGMELRMLEQLLGTRVARRELSGGRTGQPRVIFEVTLL